MKQQAFDNERYLELQSKHIKERISSFDNKLYLEFGGKLFDDHHASRVLPGFEPDSKLKMLLTFKEQIEVVIAINANDIAKNKVRNDLGITYDDEVLRLIDAFRAVDLYVGSIVITQYNNQESADKFTERLSRLGIKVFMHYMIEGYPNNIPLIISPEGYGKNDFVETVKPLVVVTAPGPGSGKMAVCLSQIYQEHNRGVQAGYAKFETFPIWDLPLKHPVNLAYESATADLSDINMIDPFHLEAYGKTTVNYNRDVEIYPVLNLMFQRIFGESPYKSPTDMGVNMVGQCIMNDEAARAASKEEIVRRYYNSKVDLKMGHATADVVAQLELIMAQADVTPSHRKCAVAAMDRQEETGGPACCIELEDGTLITGRTTSLLGSSSACLLNTLKHLAGIDDDVHLISPTIIEPIQELKVNCLGNNNPRLHTDEVLVALAVSATSNSVSRHALDQLHKLRECEAHSSVILSEADMKTFKKLQVNITCQDQYQSKKLYHKK